MALAMAGLCLVTACGPKGGNTAAAGGAAVTGGAPASGPDQVVNFSDLPHPRAGLWQETLDNGDGKPATTTSCLSGKTPSVKMPKDCSQFTIKRTFLGAYLIDMNCAMPEFTMVSHAEATGDFQTSMSSDMTMTMTPKGQAPRTTKMHVESHFIGPCAPGQTPDDEGAGSSARG
ncbi:MAG: DUF3617 domain-containing protein [Caulobacterales bacterium]